MLIRILTTTALTTLLATSAFADDALKTGNKLDTTAVESAINSEPTPGAGTDIEMKTKSGEKLQQSSRDTALESEPVENGPKVDTSQYEQDNVLEDPAVETALDSQSEDDSMATGSTKKTY